MDIASIVFACTTASHLGLTAAVIGVFFRNRRTLPVISCPRCLAFWCVLAYGLCAGFPATTSAVIRLLAISFLSAYMAIWLELAEGLIDRLYDYVYKQIYPTADTADDDKAGA